MNIFWKCLSRITQLCTSFHSIDILSLFSDSVWAHAIEHSREISRSACKYNSWIICAKCEEEKKHTQKWKDWRHYAAKVNVQKLYVRCWIAFKYIYKNRWWHFFFRLFFVVVVWVVRYYWWWYFWYIQSLLLKFYGVCACAKFSSIAHKYVMRK